MTDSLEAAQLGNGAQPQVESDHAGTDSRLGAQDLVVGYGDDPVLDGLGVRIPTGEFTAVVGPNACGKSTLLRTLARMLTPDTGVVELDGAAIGSMAPKAVARVLGLLPQSPSAPEALVVEDLVGRGRHPHQRLLRQWSNADTRAVEQAMQRASVTGLADRPVNELSGGQRQRAWLAMVLAQETPILLLDEPTTYLDITHQLEVLDLCDDLRVDGFTVVAVLHDLNLAFRYATNLIVMSDGAIVTEGKPTDVVDADLLATVFGLRCRIVPDPETDTPLVVPLRRGR